MLFASSDTTLAHPEVGVYQVIRRFEVSDVYGNVADSLQTFTILDDVPPVFTFVPPGDTVCDFPPPLVQAQAVDNCGDVTMVSLKNSPEDALGNETLVRRYEAFDLAGIPLWPPRSCDGELRAPRFWTVPATSPRVRPTLGNGLPEVVKGAALGAFGDRGHP